jgi:hypothetical protein
MGMADMLGWLVGLLGSVHQVHKTKILFSRAPDGLPTIGEKIPTKYSCMFRSSTGTTHRHKIIHMPSFIGAGT